MLKFTFKEDDQYNIFLSLDGTEVGRIAHDNLIPENLYNRLKTTEEIKLVESLDNPDKYIYLNYITIHEGFRGKGLFKEAMSLFERYARNLGHSAITLFSPIALKEVYEEMFYEDEGYITSVGHYLMIRRMIVPITKSSIFEK